MKITIGGKEMLFKKKKKKVMGSGSLGGSVG